MWLNLLRSERGIYRPSMNYPWYPGNDAENKQRMMLIHKSLPKQNQNCCKLRVGHLLEAHLFHIHALNFVNKIMHTQNSKMHLEAAANFREWHGLPMGFHGLFSNQHVEENSLKILQFFLCKSVKK